MDPVMLPVMTATVNITDRIAPARVQRVENQQEQVEDKVDLSGTNVVSIEEKPEIINKSAYNDLENLKTDLNDCKNFVRMAEGKINSTNNGLQDASRELNFSDFPLQRVQMDNDKTDVSREGYSIDQYFSSAERELKNSKREDDSAGIYMEELQKKLTIVQHKLKTVNDTLNLPQEDNASLLLDKAFQLAGDSQLQAGKCIRDTDMVGREISSSSGQLSFADSYIWNIKSDRPGKDVSYDGRQLSYLVDRSQWDIRDAEREIRDAQYDLIITKQSLEKIHRAVTDAQSELMKKKSE